VSDYDPTIEDSYTKICTVDGKETRLDSKADMNELCVCVCVYTLFMCVKAEEGVLHRDTLCVFALSLSLSLGCFIPLLGLVHSARCYRTEPGCGVLGHTPQPRHTAMSA